MVVALLSYNLLIDFTTFQYCLRSDEAFNPRNSIVSNETDIVITHQPFLNSIYLSKIFFRTYYVFIPTFENSNSIQNKERNLQII